MIERCRKTSIVAAILLLASSAALPTINYAQKPSEGDRLAASQKSAEGDRLIASLKTSWPDVYARLIGLERAHGVYFGVLAAARGKGNEADVYRLMLQRMTDRELSARPDPEATKGYAALGARGAEIIKRTHAFHREVLAIFATVERAQREAALDSAVERYLSRPTAALPDVPKDMTILYDHPYTSFVADDFDPRRELKYPKLTGLVWASHWFELAVPEPLQRATDTAERRDGLTLVAEKFERKLSEGKPPDAFPTELPLAPSISPELVSAHVRAAAIIDNLFMMEDVLAETMVHPKVTNLRAAIDEVIGQFCDRTYRVVEVDDWITMALRHSIFEQGGPALGTMTQSDRNSSGHVQHIKGGSGAIPPGGMR